MSQNSQERFILTKSYEVGYAIFRLAAQMTDEKDFGAQLKAAASALLAATAAERYPEAGGALQVLECLVKFASDVNILGTANGEVTLREIYALDRAIAERKTAIKTDRVNVQEIFSKSEIAERSKPESYSAKPNSATPYPAKSEPAIRQTAGYEEPMPKIIESDVSEDIEADTPNINIILKSAIRQTAILDRIRQSGNCRLKDIQEILPECSERTIRYDLQTLLEQNLIERVGSAGPSVFYRERQATEQI